MQAEKAVLRFVRTAKEPTLSPYELRRMEQLSDLADGRDLTAREEAERRDLLSAYDRSVLRRAQTLALLKQRGHDLNSVFEQSAVVS